MTLSALFGVFAVACASSPRAVSSQSSERSAVASSRPSSSTSPAPEARFVAIAAGHRHACVVESKGRVQCWGDDSFGQTGGGAPTPRPGASCFPPLSGKQATDPTLLAAGSYCVAYARVRSTPVVVPIIDVVALAAGARHTCALTRGRAVWCWGDNTAGQLGLVGYANHVGRPVRVPSIEADEIVAGEEHTCVRAIGQPYRCFGRTVGKPEPYAPSPPLDPALAGKLGSLRALGADFGCAADDGGVHCVGNNGSGQLGGGRSPALIADDPPGPVLGITDAVSISMRDRTACALLRDGSVRCWGEGRTGALGSMLPHASFTTAPLTIPDLSSATAVETNGDVTCVRTHLGALACYHENGGTHPSSLRPVEPEELAPSVELFAIESAHGCWTHDGALACRGSWEHGTASIPSFVPALAKSVKKVRALVADVYRTCALRAGGEIVCFGDRFEPFDPPRPYGQAPTWKAPHSVRTIKGAVEIAMGQNWLCVRSGDGTLECPIVSGKYLAPKQRVRLANDASEVSDGPCFVRRDGSAACADLEKGTIAPVPVEDVLSVRGSCALKKNSSVWCWGDGRATGRGGVADWSVDAVAVQLSP